MAQKYKPIMRIAIDISPLQSGHKIRGVGFYIEYLKRSLLRYFPDNEYLFFTKEKEIINKPDIIHYPYFEPFFLTLPIIKKYKTVVTIHDLTPLLYPQHFPAGIKGKIKWKIQKQIVKKSDAIITDSYTSQKDIARILKIKKAHIKVAYLAAAEEFKKLPKGKWAAEITNKFNLPEKFVLYVGDVTWNKNLPTLIEAIKMSNLTLVLVGKKLLEKDFDKTNPWNKDLIKAQKMIEGDKRFIRLGFVSTPDLVALYNTATVLVFPSMYEGFGLPILEAMQSGCPVVLAKEGTLREVGGEAAYYVNPFNANNIAVGIGEVFYTPKLQQKLSQKGLEQAQKFSWQKTAGETVKAYKHALDN
jgi:glycosyltransferase involved in cell wall biosynthesis